MMNRQQRRQAERQAKKDQKDFRDVMTDPKGRGKHEGAIRQAFSEGQIFNNHDWAVRLERIREIKGIGEKTLEKIFKALEEPLDIEEREKSRRNYENGVDQVDQRG